MEAAKTCRNCHAQVSGEYCASCGQREGRADQRFMDLAGELTGDLLDWDSRVWRTLISLLFCPGKLTAEFIAGRRAPYLPPLRLYLIISFILFLLVSVTASDSLILEEGQKNALAEPGVEVTVDPNEVPDDWADAVDLAQEDSPPWLKNLDAQLSANLSKLQDDPSEFVESMVDYLPQMMFLLLPVFALIIQFVYLFSGFHYLQHLVFSLHYHSFAYLFYLIAMALETVGLHLDGWIMLALVIYMPLAFRRAYGSGWGAAIGKSLLVYNVYAVLLLVGFAAVALLALVLL